MNMAKVKEYVAYTPLGNYAPGDVVNPADWPLEEWTYMVEHEVVVVKNSPNDPNVLAEQAEEKAEEKESREADVPRDDPATAAHKAATAAKSASKSEPAKPSPTSSGQPKSEPAKPTPKKEG